MNSFISRALITAGAAGGAMLLAGGIASAHVTVTAPGAARGGDAELTFRVPNESATGSPTVKLAVQLPAVNSAATAPIPGWKAALTKDAGDKVTGITWTADPGTGIGPDQFGQFSVWAENLPDQAQLSMPAVQTYADGQVVKWDQVTKAGQPEPENPAPTITLAAKDSDQATDASPSNSDNAARWLGGIGIAVGVVALASAAALLLLVRRRRA